MKLPRAIPTLLVNTLTPFNAPQEQDGSPVCESKVRIAACGNVQKNDDSGNVEDLSTQSVDSYVIRGR